MDLFSRQNIRKLLKKYQTKPLKRLGQNFLIDKRVIKKVIETAELKPNDTILEIGPGVGTLTQEIAPSLTGGGKVIAVEKDSKMIEILKETLKDFKNVEVIYGDILKLDPNPYPLNPYKVVANLPFYLTAPVIRKLLEAPFKPKMMALIVQKEVGQRICASPAKVFVKPARFRVAESKSDGQKFRRARPGKMSILAVSVQLYAQPKIISYISKKSFWPQPKVDSAIIKITPKPLPKNLQRPGLCKFFRIVKAGFSQPRKQLVNNLSKGLKIDKIKIEQWLLKNNIQPSQRAETLSIKDWLKLTKGQMK